MFNAPRPTQRILSGNAGFGGSFVDDNGPLAGSAYDGLDPWSGTATPSPPPMPSGTTSVFNSVIGEEQLCFTMFDGLTPIWLHSRCYLAHDIQ